VPDGWPRADSPFTFVTDGIESAIEKAKADAPVELEGPTSVVQGTDVTHLRYRVRY
jgi:hypothetical protein